MAPEISFYAASLRVDLMVGFKLELRLGLWMELMVVLRGAIKNTYILQHFL